MNKFALMLIFFGFLMVNGFIYQKFYRPAELQSFTIDPNQEPIVIEMHSRENKWEFEPSRIEAMVGDRVVLRIYNEDSFDHGVAFETFGINKRLFPKEFTDIEILASRPGEYPFYCSVPCGEGHYRQKGVLVIKPKPAEEPVQ